MKELLVPARPVRRSTGVKVIKMCIWNRCSEALKGQEKEATSNGGDKGAGECEATQHRLRNTPCYHREAIPDSLVSYCFCS
ncbi:hypothetical protein RB195_017925 [Necator americanus]|uniref:Uncharacterized protein n=1 Tax=Necator americanus TaxID=51031 RepID=A0ABR1C942_NECAM